MAQATDYVLSNQSGASFRAELNTMLAAIVSANSGATEPATTYAYMLWADTSSGILKQRNEANNAWISLLNLADGSVLDDTITTAKLAFDSGALGNRNILINSGFRINQRSYVSGAVLAAGAYGHDRFKAGASGGDYSFTQLNTNTQITIASGKSLIQVVEDKNVHETAYVLSWEGTAQARVGVNTATPSGSYASSPILITGQTAGTTMSVEFNTGTLGKAQLEKGSITTPFENSSYAAELALCQRYYYRLFPASTGTTLAVGWGASTIVATGIINFPVEMRIAPTSIDQAGTANLYSINDFITNTTCSSVPILASGSTSTRTGGVAFTVAAGLTQFRPYRLSTDTTNGATAYIGWSSEL